LKEQGVGAFEGRGGFSDVVGRERVVGPGSDRDAVFSILADNDKRDARGISRGLEDSSNVHPGARQAVERLPSKSIGSHPGHETNESPGAGGGHGLIGPFASGGGGEFASADGFTRAGKPWSRDGQVDVGTADDKDDRLGSVRIFHRERMGLDNDNPSAASIIQKQLEEPTDEISTGTKHFPR
jgi:hypothetical protein